MRKLSLIFFCVTLAVGLILLLSGCQGDEGLVGIKGIKGPKGNTGVDPERLAPAGRNIVFGLTNASLKAATGKKKVYLSFDSTAKATKDTIVANRVDIPPLIDGVDNEDVEWGEKKSALTLTYLTPDSGFIDPMIYKAKARAAYDDDYIYMFFQWQEVKVTGKYVDSRGNLKDTTYVDATESKEVNELFFNRKTIDSIVARPSGRIDTTYFKFIRVPVLGCDSVCKRWKDNDPTTGICEEWLYYNCKYGDTTYKWLPSHQGEDRCIILFGDDAIAGWQDLALQELFGFSGAGSGLTADFFVDAWIWGASTSLPTGTADDWFIDHSGAAPDAGRGPYIDNWIYPDSVPRYMNLRDPNLRTQDTPTETTYPLWYYEAAGYFFSGWSRLVACYLPGVVTTIPSNSRADVYAAARSDGNGLWTLELRRARKTNTGDDVQF